MNDEGEIRTSSNRANRNATVGLVVVLVGFVLEHASKHFPMYPWIPKALIGGTLFWVAITLLKERGKHSGVKWPKLIFVSVVLIAYGWDAFTTLIGIQDIFELRGSVQENWPLLFVSLILTLILFIIFTNLFPVLHGQPLFYYPKGHGFKITFIILYLFAFLFDVYTSFLGNAKFILDLEPGEAKSFKFLMEDSAGGIALLVITSIIAVIVIWVSRLAHDILNRQWNGNGSVRTDNGASKRDNLWRNSLYFILFILFALAAYIFLANKFRDSVTFPEYISRCDSLLTDGEMLYSICNTAKPEGEEMIQAASNYQASWESWAGVQLSRRTSVPPETREKIREFQRKCDLLHSLALGGLSRESGPINHNVFHNPIRRATNGKRNTRQLIDDLKKELRILRILQSE